jgi:hypothetical protein
MPILKGKTFVRKLLEMNTHKWGKMQQIKGGEYTMLSFRNDTVQDGLSNKCLESLPHASGVCFLGELRRMMAVGAEWRDQ